MSFTFNWPRFSDQFHYDAIQMLNTALNKGNKPPIIADKIEVVELEMGTKPPELEIRDIGDLTVDQFRGIFRLTYSGDAHLVLKTKVQANPLNQKQPDIHLLSGSRGMLAAKQPLVVPMLLRLSQFKLNSYVVLVVSKQKGITLVFKTDPLQNVDINSTFDSIAVIQKFIQREIEGQLRQMFREDLPGIIHRLSQQWVKAKVEAPYLERRIPAPPPRRTFTSQSNPDMSMSLPHLGLRSIYPQPLGPIGYPKPRSLSGSVAGSSTSRNKGNIPVVKPPTPTTSTTPNSDNSTHPDLDNFDPTYGLRPEGLPTRSIFKGFSSLFSPDKGLADLAEETNEDFGEFDDDGAASFDMVDWNDSVPDISPPPSTAAFEPTVEYETIPAIGGGTITRPRIYHSQSLLQPSAAEGSPSISRSSSTQAWRSFRHAESVAPTPVSWQFHAPSPVASRRQTFNPYFPDYPASQRPSFSIGEDSFPDYPSPGSTASYRFPHVSPQRPSTPDNSASTSRTESLPTPPSYLPPREPSIYATTKSSQDSCHQRRLSVTSSLDSHTFRPGSPSSQSQTHNTGDAKIILRPSLNNSIHQLSTLSHSNHTLSPFTRSMEHYTVRSVPPRIATANRPMMSPDKPPTKAKRKRTFQLGSKRSASSPLAAVDQDPHLDPNSTLPSPPSSPLPSSEFDASDMDRYFRSIDDFDIRALGSSSRNVTAPQLHQRKNVRTQ